MAAPIQIANQLDFTGGLNLVADAFKLAKNESPDLLNVDVDPRGGFRQRGAVLPFNSTVLAGTVDSMWEFEQVGGVKQVMCHANNLLYYSTGGAWSAVSGTNRLTRCVAKSMISNGVATCYIQTGAADALSWVGSGIPTALGVAFNNTYASGARGNMPRAKYMAVHQGAMWIANTSEGGQAFPNRVRFSHPGEPERWRDIDSIEVDDGADGDEIVGIVPMGDRLVVFKRRSIHAIFGTGPDQWIRQPITTEVGACGPDAIVKTDTGVWFFSWPNGVFFYDGKSIQYMFDRLEPAISDGFIPDAYAGGIAMGWGNRRLWVSVPWGASTANARTFVLDPRLGKTGAWVAYDLGLSCFVNWRPTGSDTLFLAGKAGSSRTFKLDQQSVTDDFGSGAVPIGGYYRTRWVDLGQPAQRKRWKTPEFVLKAGTSGDIPVEVYKDYDPGSLLRSFTLASAADSNTLVWDSGTWDEKNWAAVTSTASNRIVRGKSFGTCKSVSLVIKAPLIPSSWGVDAVALKYIPKPVRN